MSSRPKLRDTKSRMQISIEPTRDSAVADAKKVGEERGKRKTGSRDFTLSDLSPEKEERGALRLQRTRSVS